MIWSLLLFLGSAGLWLCCYWSFRAGKAEEDAAHEEETNDASEKAALVRDRLGRDARFSGRVRRRFTR